LYVCTSNRFRPNLKIGSEKSSGFHCSVCSILEGGC
jgi:hypothetical protein